MKKVIGLFLSLIVLMGLSACEAELPDDSKKPNPEPKPEETECLTFVSSGESSVTLVKVGKPFDISLEYSLDGTNWNPYTIGETIYLLEDKLSFRAGKAGNRRFSKGADDYYQFNISGEIATSGSIMSLLDRSCCKNVIPSYAFFNLFRDCTGLTKAPELPATNLAERCYWGMFSGCTSLTEAPELPATVLTEACYSSMFSGCTNLTEAPELPATELVASCYSNMFWQCTSLTKAPELPATELAERCYSNMFRDCINLNYVKALFTDEPSEETTSGWLSGVSSTGTFVKSKDAMWDVRGDDGIPKGWTVESDAGTSDDSQKPNPDESMCLTFVSSGKSTIALIKKGEPFEITLEYSVDGEVWEPYTIGETLELADGGELMFRAGEDGNANFSAGLNNYYKFSFSGEIAAKGSIMSLLDRSCHKNAVPRNAFSGLFMYCRSLTSAPTLPATELGGCCYYCMFRGCTSLTKAPELPATKLAVRCYSWMFEGCMNLIDAPELPATKLAEECYSWMFSGCTNLIDAPALPATKLAERCYWGIFSGCARLTEAPELPATELAQWCYDYMFGTCESLTKAPALPATKLAGSCYDYMFEGCTNLTEAPELPATELAENCYGSMFKGCTNLTEAPELPATELVTYCYSSMFLGCTSLTKAPVLPAIVLAYGCYNSMFKGCTGLTEAPELPATELAQWCYSNMFYGCTSLTKAPELPATELAASCYSNMFFGCTNLKFVKALFTDKPSEETTEYWLLGVSYTGIFVKSKDATWDVRGSSGIPEGWTVESDTGTSDDSQKPNPEENGCLTFVSSEGSTIALIKEGEPSEITLEYSMDGKSWIPYTIGKTLELLDREKLMFRAGEQGNDFFSSNNENYYNFKITGSVAAKGNIMSLLDRSCQKNTVPSNAFNSLFKYCRTLTSAPDLPAMKLASGCYFQMFAGCTSLTEAPILPTMELAKWCYSYMFWYCTSMTKAPALPAMELAEHCYDGMFRDCTSLTEGPVLPATELASDCYSYMFKGCIGLTKAPMLPAIYLDFVCYFCMFEGCTSLIEAPALPATELNASCYTAMFSGCTSLTEAPALPATELAPGCYSNMFQGCTSLTKAPVLPATELAASCYSNMFYGCTSLNYVKALFTDKPSVETTENWLSDVSPTGTFVKSKDATWNMMGPSGIPEGWTVESDGETSDDSHKPNPDEPLCLTFVSSGESTIALIKKGDPSEITLEYSMDGKSWIPYTIGKTLELLDREKLMFRAGKQGNAFFSLNPSRCYYFKISGSVAARGNIMSLLDRKCERNSVPIQAFNSLFKYCEALTSAPTLPATELGENCYNCMFRGCTSLTEAPALPAKVMAKVCYSGMFWGCTSLTKAPALPAIELAEYCYVGMFRDCTSLTEAPALPATELASRCYGSMFEGCTSLTTAPTLPATKLASRCYYGMFRNCANLSYIKALFTDEPSEETTKNWLSGVSPTGTFVKSKDATWDFRGVNGIPEGWTVITE